MRMISPSCVDVRIQLEWKSHIPMGVLVASLLGAPTDKANLFGFSPSSILRARIFS
jgi:hypothetical protein